MTHAGYVLAGWGSTLLVLGGYACWLVRRGRRLASAVLPGERRWSGSDAS